MTIQIRTMTAADLPLGMWLKEQARWNQTEEDWRRFLAMGQDGCFVAELDGQAVGTTVITPFGSVAWIAMVLVNPACRSRGVGTTLMEHALKRLDGLGWPTVRLDATSLGLPIYEKLGFAREYEVARWEGVAQMPKESSSCESATPAVLDAIAELDQGVTGTARGSLLEAFFRQSPGAMRFIRNGDRFVGYSTHRPGTRATQIGPAVSLVPEVGLALANAAAAELAGKPVFVDIPVDNRAATDWAKAQGLSIQRVFTRMVRGQPVTDRPSDLWASSGPENG